MDKSEVGYIVINGTDVAETYKYRDTECRILVLRSRREEVLSRKNKKSDFSWIWMSVEDYEKTFQT